MASFECSLFIGEDSEKNRKTYIIDIIEIDIIDDQIAESTRDDFYDHAENCPPCDYEFNDQISENLNEKICTALRLN